MNPLHTVFLIYIIAFYQLESGKVILNHSPFPSRLPTTTRKTVPGEQPGGKPQGADTLTEYHKARRRRADTRRKPGIRPCAPAAEGEDLASTGSLSAYQQTEGVCVRVILIVSKNAISVLLLVMWMCVLLSVFRF
jgi:hypothetical protein